MISIGAQAGIRSIFLDAVKSRLTLDPADRCTVRPMECVETGMPQECNAYVLTVSSLQFKVMVILRAGLDEETRQYYVRGRAEKSFDEVFMEVANLCCGAINKELIRYFPDLGMSTPYRLSSHSMRFIDSLKPSHLTGFIAVINESVTLSATACVCAHAPVDFAYEPSAAEQESGELEMF